MTTRPRLRTATAAAAATLTALALPLTTATPAAATTTVINVTTTTDTIDGGDGLTSLREAVDLANAAGDAAEIVLAPAATYTLSLCPAGADDNTNATGDLDLTGSNDVTITGNGATIEQSCPGSRHLDWTPASGTPVLTITDATLVGATEVKGGTSIASNRSLRLHGVIIDGNSGADSWGNAAVMTSGTGSLEVTNSQISSTAMGAAIGDYQSGPPTVIIGSIITDNWGTNADVTGIYVSQRDLFVTNSTISENRPSAAALPSGPVYADAIQAMGPMPHYGAIAAPEHSVTISGSTVHHNAGAYAGGIAGKHVTIDKSTISENFAAAPGAGVNALQATIDSATFFANSAGLVGSDVSIEPDGEPSFITNSTLSGGRGGSILTAAPLTIHRSTITAQASSHPQGGVSAIAVAEYETPVAVTITESTISGNQFVPTPPVTAKAAEITAGSNATLIVRSSVLGSSTSTVPVCQLDGTTLVSQGHNFGSDGTCGLADPSDVSAGGDPMLGALADNGGVTETMVPLPGSPLLDAVPAVSAGCVGETSQNALALPQGLGCEIGAAEVASSARLAGHVTSAYTGLPLAGIEVRVRSLANTNVSMTTTGPDGTWTVAGLAAGDYKVLFRDQTGEHNQTFNGSAWPFSAAPAVTVAGDHTTVADQALTVDNAITGTVTDTKTGLPVAGVQIRVRTADNTYIRTATTNAAGTYTIADLAPGDYKLLFRDPTGAHEQTFNGSAWPFSAAPTITVTTGTVTIDQAMVPIPAIDGTVTQDGTGAPLAGIEIRVRTLANTYLGSTTTAPDGTWTIHLPAGTYKLLYTDPTGTHLTEWHDNKPGFATATPITHTPTGETLTASLTPAP